MYRVCLEGIIVTRMWTKTQFYYGYSEQSHQNGIIPAQLSFKFGLKTATRQYLLTLQVDVEPASQIVIQPQL